MSGWLRIIGLGPGAASLRTPEAEAALAEATDILGYGPYVARVAARTEQRVHPTDNREELDRARHALELAETGARVAVVSSGDPGVFAMAAAVFEAVEHGPAPWRDLDIQVLPGISAMFAAAARLGAPLGHDFCAISLSDNLKPWELVEKRLRLAAEAGFVLALYNPISRARPWQLGRAFALLREHLPGTVPVAFATAISRPEERMVLRPLAEANPALADMRTLVLVGSAATRMAGRFLYTPRSAASA
ncbi:precorrin-3B C(17)-methyltransferase [Teichococcus oryzae]|uniref:Precorrin-3B C(17)-methyltransferase n=1 Tax=Teichococcus oryzae TaxID=1608942 RepID=A0A5B2TCJ7_9PROT|nr:precorrin-3B C(17)-methyltransferase [Pseudoroseomonas oryzae]KAA2211804.1 precorrin-3B C(17)-methyltransferase [Pseudoroseomonas oryzae]